MEMEHVIPASEFTRNFGRYQMLAQREPVAVTSHGRTTGYFIAAEDYEAFKRFKESRRSFATVELPDDKAKAISASRMDDRHKHLDSMLDE
jgi:PHD/YefM family antitoxin component YafN of YafNO toxin-antitoxin module